MDSTIQDGFVLSEAAEYAFQCQDVYGDTISFAAAIPDHLKPLFLIPVQIQVIDDMDEMLWSIAGRVSSSHRSRLSSYTGQSDASDIFSYNTFVNYDNSPNMPQADEGSMYDAFLTPGDIPASQPGDQFSGGEPRYDARVWSPDTTSYMTDGDTVDLMINEGYPYRTNEKVRHSFVMPVRVRIAIKPEVLQKHAPDKIKDRARSCKVSFVSYYKPDRMYTFSANCGNGPHMVRAVLSEIDEITMTCDCQFWRWGGPEYHARTQKFLMGRPRGTASPPNVRDPDRKHWLCKHAYSVLKRLEHHVQKIVDENWDQDDDDLLRTIDNKWDQMSEDVEVSLEKIESEEDESEYPKIEIGDVERIDIEDLDED